MTLVRRAADLALADYAFAAAAELYEVAARHAQGTERIDVLIMLSDALRFRGRWDEARDALKQAASLAKSLGNPGREAMALVHLERLTWRYGLHEKELTQQIRDVIARLPAGESVLRAQAQAVLTARLSISPRQYENEQADLARTLLRQLPSVTDPVARADMILGIRAGLLDIVPPDDLLDFDRQAFDLALSLRSAYHLEEALASRITDLIRGGRLAELPPALRAYRDFAEQSGTTVSRYTQALLQAMLALARGEFTAASEHTGEAARLSGPWGESMAREALMGQMGWLLYETGQVDGLTEALADLAGQSVSAQNDPVWALAAGLIHAEKGETTQAIRLLREVSASSGEFSGLPRGLSRIAVLATAAMVIGHPALDNCCRPTKQAAWENASLTSSSRIRTRSWSQDGQRSCSAASTATSDSPTWPPGKPATAAVHLARADDENSEFAVLHTRTQFRPGQGSDPPVSQPRRRRHGNGARRTKSGRARDGRPGRPGCRRTTIIGLVSNHDHPSQARSSRWPGHYRRPYNQNAIEIRDPCAQAPHGMVNMTARHDTLHLGHSGVPTGVSARP